MNRPFNRARMGHKTWTDKTPAQLWLHRLVAPCTLSPQIGIIPYAGVDITAFELLKQRLLEEHDGRPPPPAVFAAGMLSSCVAQFVSYPLALVRTRMQVGCQHRAQSDSFIKIIVVVMIVVFTSSS
jgi:Mitochondrial carrier protein